MHRIDRMGGQLDVDVQERLESRGLCHFLDDRSMKMDADGAPSFASRWRGKFKAAERGEARYDALTKKYLT